MQDNPAVTGRDFYYSKEQEGLIAQMGGAYGSFSNDGGKTRTPYTGTVGPRGTAETMEELRQKFPDAVIVGKEQRGTQYFNSEPPPAARWPRIPSPGL